MFLTVFEIEILGKGNVDIDQIWFVLRTLYSI